MQVGTSSWLSSVDFGAETRWIILRMMNCPSYQPSSRVVWLVSRLIKFFSTLFILSMQKDFQLESGKQLTFISYNCTEYVYISADYVLIWNSIYLFSLFFLLFSSCVCGVCCIQEVSGAWPSIFLAAGWLLFFFVLCLLFHRVVQLSDCPRVSLTVVDDDDGIFDPGSKQKCS